MEDFGVLEAGEFLAEPSTGFFERLDNTGVDQVPLRLGRFALEIAAHLFGAAARLGEALAEFGVIHQGFDGAEAVGPVGKILASERPIARPIAARAVAAAR